MYITLSQEGMNPITISTESGAADAAATGGGPIDDGTQQAVQQMQELNVKINDLNAKIQQAAQQNNQALVAQLSQQRGPLVSQYNNLRAQVNAVTGKEMQKSSAGMPSNGGRGTTANYDSAVGQQSMNASNLQQLQDERNNLIQQMQNAPESQRGMYEAQLGEVNNKINALQPQEETPQSNPAVDYAKDFGKQYLNTMKNSLSYKATNAGINAIGKAGSAVWEAGKAGADGIKKSISNGIDNIKNKDWSAAVNTGKDIAGKTAGGLASAGKAVVANGGTLAAGATLGAIAIAAARFLGGTIFNAVASIGKFTSGNEMIASPKFQAKLNAIKSKYPAPYPTPEQVKSDPRAQSKVGFLSWLVGGGSAGKKMMNQVGSVGTLIKNINGITVGISTMSPLNAQQLAGLKVMIATAFVNKGGKLTSVPVARAFLAKGSVVNASREAADIYFDADGFCFKKNHIIDMANKTMESFGPIPSIQSSIINEYCI